MRRVTTTLALATAVALSACGGGNPNPAERTTPPAGPTAGGGTVGVVKSAGRLGAPVTVDKSGSHVIGKAGPISPKAAKPTSTQQNGVAGGVACASASSTPAANNLASMKAAILCLLNSERAAKGLPSLHLNSRLAKAARSFARLMVRKHFFAHEAPSGSTPLSRIKRTGYVRGVWQIGENLAWGSGVLASPRAIVNGWMNSPGHRENILHGQYRDIGIGIKLGPPGNNLAGGATYVTDFGRHS